MKWLRTVIIFDQGKVVSDAGWERVHSSYVRAIERIDFPEGSGSLTIKRKARASDGKWKRNGVGYLKARFLEGITKIEGWRPEAQFAIEELRCQPELRLYPSLEAYLEPITSGFGGFDFMTETETGLHVAIEWETGNISSSHRSMNKLVTALSAGKIQVGVLILPSRMLYEHLTDRIGNIGELSPYLHYWNSLTPIVEKGLLVVSVVEHDHLTDDENHPYLKVGEDGRAREGREAPPKNRVKRY